MERDTPAPGPVPEQALGQLLARLESAMGAPRARAGDAPAGPQALPDPHHARIAGWLHDLRRARAGALPAYLFGEAAWDILLHLYQRQARGMATSVEDACAASGIAGTASHRWLTLLEKDGLVCRYYPDADGQGASAGGHVRLSGEGVERMNRFLAPLAAALAPLAATLAASLPALLRENG